MAKVFSKTGIKFIKGLWGRTEPGRQQDGYGPFSFPLKLRSCQGIFASIPEHTAAFYKTVCQPMDQSRPRLSSIRRIYGLEYNQRQQRCHTTRRLSFLALTYDVYLIDYVGPAWSPSQRNGLLRISSIHADNGRYLYWCCFYSISGIRYLFIVGWTLDHYLCVDSEILTATIWSGPRWL